MFGHAVLTTLSFLALGILLGYAVGSARTAKKYAEAAIEESHEVNVKVSKLEVKIDETSITRDSDTPDEANEHDLEEHFPEEENP